ncbi:hypothetical protein [Candidatus Liberibacter asiaticus]|uniref:Uncharacterized protein n=2 Tax=Liberibacter asiaticus TaxID=34021 RepID=C6XHE3_LIBAP|nr:hypothetical protein [Candidatus Liberibacter asiaticus]AGH16454.1 hypothetical protein WSI_00395 [Candidatus Liberibacter asiaticus str. gxpsy]BAP25972.1 hypothetical protein CGUJ_00490 [Candidatus Liberibacter asiaticus str. Ishi-1]ACT56686.1 hypothetical protein CLIBASIA_00490 [Candidatus Liberibacter asiaticus str. psy62]ALK06861.1 hypothetical protein CD16_00415 [Candidatus Liberibacter asiaticus]ASK52330.1 hypothetical protein B2I23_00435 [Candidatus Liberibacter asiaticus]
MGFITSLSKWDIEVNSILKEEIDDISVVSLPLSDDNMTIDEEYLEKLVVESLDRSLRCNYEKK